MTAIKHHQHGPNAYTIQISTGTNGIIIGFSYQTPVAFTADGKDVASETLWGTTTGKHINQFAPLVKPKDRLSREVFEAALSDALERAFAGIHSDTITPR